MPSLCSSIKHRVVDCGVSWHSLCAFGEGQWQWELGRASFCNDVDQRCAWQAQARDALIMSLVLARLFTVPNK